MVEYTTRAELISLSADVAKSWQVLKEASERAAAAHTTFLSYNSKDNDVLAGVIQILENHGAAVYIDKIDDTLPVITNRDTAATLRQRIAVCKKFVAIASENSKSSKWVPWEIGIADSNKQASNVAIFPALESEGDRKWTEREYLGLYDRIVWGRFEGEADHQWLVWNQEKNSAVRLSTWLSR